MFEAKLKADILKEMVDVVSTLVDEAKFNVGKDSIAVKAVDPAHVAMVDLSLDRSAFEGYKAEEAELGIDMDKMKEILRLAKAGDVISLNHDEDKNRLVVAVGNTTRRMSLVDTAGMSDPKVPSLNLPAKLTVRTDELRQAIRASESVSDHIALKASNEGFEVVSEGDTDTVSHMVSKDMLDELQAKDAVRSLFPLDYFSNMVKAISSAQTVTLYLGTDYPVKMEFKIA
ncbi:MAG TPA: proliferating cell nuclear antigen (pcna), partial [Thermoplasmata archaeon]